MRHSAGAEPPGRRRRWCRPRSKERLGIFAPGGGYVFNQVHNIQAPTSRPKTSSPCSTQCTSSTGGSDVPPGITRASHGRYEEALRRGPQRRRQDGGRDHQGSHRREHGPARPDLGHDGAGDGRGGQAVRGGGVLRARAAPLGPGHERVDGAAPAAPGRARGQAHGDRRHRHRARETCTISARTWWPRCSRGAASR